ncbi:MAG: hypothetical protein IKY07_03690, partial [Clostridia bacterium]|nr:hypothetical protein [Clostridia bacterium]
MKPAAIFAAAAICAVAANCKSADIEPNPPAGKWTFYPSSASKLDGGALADRMTVNEKFLLETVNPDALLSKFLTVAGLE